MMQAITNEYGWCPNCGAPGHLRERRLNGNDTCKMGHVYSSRESLSWDERERRATEWLKARITQLEEVLSLALYYMEPVNPEGEQAKEDAEKVLALNRE